MSSIKFRPTTDLHYHVDAMSARAIYAVCKKFELPWSGKSFAEVTELAQAKEGCNWDDWYKVHTRAREAVFREPKIFEEVAYQAVIDAELERLSTRVMRFSLSMPDFCFQAIHKRKPDLTDPKDKMEFLSLLDQVIDNLDRGIANRAGEVNTPLVFSISCQDKFLPLLDDLASITLNHRDYIVGIDLTNEQTHKLVTDYRNFLAEIYAGGINSLTIHIAEKEPEDMTGQYTAEERITAALSLFPETLGHAIYAVKYPEVISKIAESEVVVELCPNSNLTKDYIKRGLDGNIENYPLLQFQNAGIPCTINSDTPATAGTTLLDEFLLVQEIFGLSEIELQKLDDVAKETASSIYNI